ncbi:hypothetical protein [Roseibium sp. RKSG952]|uniref:hypothetical protein n=1 Tax=Roseibium sp. RKSG952 TaxID=2529384 RepID=UPI0012BCD8A9|nr:hypothetical protein [Roseibium sp. RKSG952]MTH96106.1 hypothetical protein [Roseibium sp. RKSG952]
MLGNYLGGSHRADRLAVSKYHYERDRITVSYRVEAHSLPYLSTLNVSECIVKLAVLYCCLDNNIRRRQSAILLRSLDLRVNSKVRTTDFECTGEILARRKLDSGVFYNGRFDVGGGAMTGLGKFFMPFETITV